MQPNSPSPSEFVLYIDFDSTLYQTNLFSDQLFKMLATQAGRSVQEVKADSTGHYAHPTLGGYDYAAHFATYGLDASDMWNRLATVAQQSNYLFADSAPFIQSLRSAGYNPKILSFGEKRFQMAKISPMLSILTGDYITGDTPAEQLEVIIVDRQKLEHITKLHAGQRGALVDDKPDQHLPSGFTEIHIDRHGSFEQPQINGTTAKVCSLAQARQVIDRLAV